MRLQLTRSTARLAMMLTVAACVRWWAGTARAEPAAARKIDVHAHGEVSGYADTDHVSVLTPAVEARLSSPTAGWDLGASYLVDVVTAASVDIVSTASPRWTEIRHAAEIDAGVARGDFGGHVAGALSVEPDYVSLSAGASIRLELDDDHLVPKLGYTYGRDEAGRSGTPFDVYSLVLQRHTVQGALTLVVNRSTEVTLGADAVLEHGRQEKPYRYLPLFDASVAGDVPAGASFGIVDALRLPGRIEERVPEDRQRFAVAGRLGWRPAGTLLAFQRLYADTWGLAASTSDVRYVADVGRRWEAWPRLRLHAQRGVSFWERAYVGEVESGLVRAPALRTGDRELGPLVSTTVGGGVTWRLGALTDAPKLGLLVEGTHTRFFDALFLRDRFAAFASIQVGGVF